MKLKETGKMGRKLKKTMVLGRSLMVLGRSTMVYQVKFSRRPLLFNSPSVAGAVLQTPVSLIN